MSPIRIIKFPYRAAWSLAYRAGLLGAIEVGVSPALDDEALQHWRSRISRGGVYLEYGSGGSTVEAVKHVSAVISVDTDRRFLAAVERKIASAVAHPAPFTPVYVNIGWTQQWGRPLMTRPSGSRIERWRRYSSAPWEILNAAHLTPNFILVDGRFRAASVLESLLRLPVESECVIMLDDFAEREARYHPIMPFIDDIQRAGRALLFRRAANFSPEECRRLLLQAQLDPE